MIVEDRDVADALFHYSQSPTRDSALDLVRQIVRAHTRRIAVRPVARPVGRMGDMAPPGKSHIQVGFDDDNDVCVAIWDAEHGDCQLAGIEFCTGVGGGKSPKTRAALVALMAAIEADNADCPRGQWPPPAASVAS